MSTLRLPASRAWDTAADWYADWVGHQGSRQHRQVTIPALLELLAPRRGERILDVGAGPGLLAPFIAGAGARYTGVDTSPRLLAVARGRHGRHGRFICADARALMQAPGLEAAAFDAAVFLLSIQDMDPLADVLRGVAWALRGGGRIVIVMTHPCFRVPRQSGWGWDGARRLHFRRVDRYLSPLPVPVPAVGPPGGASTVRFHRPLQDYINELAALGFLLDRLREIPAGSDGPVARDSLAAREFPVFLGLRARKSGQ